MSNQILILSEVPYLKLASLCKVAIEDDNISDWWLIKNEMRERMKKVQLPPAKEYVAPAHTDFTDESLMPFGKHAGIPLGEVPRHYLRWLSEQSLYHFPELKEYLIAKTSSQ
jgi:hypothetical protein